MSVHPRQYAVWPNPTSRSRSWVLESRESFYFQQLFSPPFTVGVGNWPWILKLWHNIWILSGRIFKLFLCHVSLNWAETLVVKSRQSVSYGVHLLLVIVSKLVLVVCFFNFLSVLVPNVCIFSGQMITFIKPWRFLRLSMNKIHTW